MAHFNFVISQNAKWGHAGFYIDCHRMTVRENILLQKSTVGNIGLFYDMSVTTIVTAKTAVIRAGLRPHLA